MCHFTNPLRPNTLYLNNQLVSNLFTSKSLFFLTLAGLKELKLPENRIMSNVKITSHSKYAAPIHIYRVGVYALLLMSSVFLATPAGFAENSPQTGPTYSEVNDLAQDYIKALRSGRTTDFARLYTQDSVILQNFSELLGFNMELNLLSDFSDVVISGREMGIEWGRVRFIKAEYITKRDGPFLIAHPLVIVFQHRLFRYRIQLNATKIGDSWSLVPIEREEPLILIRSFDK